jgi:flagellar basal body rod protein FlgG
MPTDGIASAASALRYWERRQEVAANNLANANTGGFKAQRAFAQLVGTSEVAVNAQTDWNEGTITTTRNPLDVTLRGPAFFVVSTPDGERYSRGGTWSVDREGFLADGNGDRVLGERGPVRIGSGSGDVSDTWVDRLRVEALPPNTALQHEDGVRWVPPAQRTPQALDARDVRQGQLEESNVSPINEMVEMISIQRNYAFAQKAITVLDDVRSTIAHDLAKPLG